MLETPDNELQVPVKESAADAPRDSVWTRWTKFIGIIGVLAVLAGILFAISIHVVALYSAAEYNLKKPDSHYYRGSAKYSVEQSNADTKHAFKVRFIMGSGVGAVIGLIYVVRCLVRDEDP